MPSYEVDAVRRAVRILRVLQERSDPMSLMELTKASGIGKATTYRMLYTLCLEGLVSQDEQSRRYRLGPSLIAFGQSALDSTDLPTVAEPHMRGLADSRGMVVYLNIASSEGVVSVHRYPKNAGSQFIRVGTIMPFHACASGLLFLAYDRGGLLQRVIDGGLTRLASGTITRVADLRQQVGQALRDGYARDLNSIDEGVASVSAPILDFHGGIVAALGVSGPEGALAAEDWTSLQVELQDSARRISAEIGRR